MSKLISMAALFALIAGSAHAQSTSVFDNKEMMSPFYTDETMTTLRSQDEYSAALNGLKSEDRDRIRSQCSGQNTQHANFCDMFKTSGN